MKIPVYFSEAGTPKTGLTPTIDIRDRSDGSLDVDDGVSVETGDGAYYYDFSAIDATKEYDYLWDGGSSLPDPERYVPGKISALTEIEKAGINAECDTALSDYGANTTVPDAAGTAATLHTTTDGKVDAVQSDSAAIKAKTDNLPSGIAKNVALPYFDFYMLLADGLTAATGKTVTGQIRKDNGAFAPITNAISEVGSGLYAIASGFTQAEMNADKVTLKFTAAACKDTIIVIYTT